MGNWIRPAGFALLSLVSTSVLASDFWVGGRNVRLDDVAQAVEGFGKVVGRPNAGMYRVSLKQGSDLGKVKRSFQARGVEHMLPVGSEHVDNRSIKSVDQHLAYARASFEARTGLTVEEGERRGMETGTDFYEGLRYWLSLRVDQNGNFDPDWLLQACKQRDALPAYRGGGPLAPTGLFEYIGPKNLDIPYTTYYGKRPLSGRKSGIAYAPSNPSIIYVSSAGGGLWKTTNGGSTWTVHSDGWIGTNAESVAVHPNLPNTVYVGTGDYEGFPIQTYGIMKSTDGGQSWTNLGQAEFGNSVVSGIVIMPNNPNIVIAITGRGSTGAASRIWRSTDAGATWTSVGQQANWDDIDISAQKPGGGYDLYVVGTATGANGGLVRRSSDNGLTWDVVPSAQLGSVPSAINIACSKIDPNTVYILDTSVAPGGVYKSTNGGTNWSSIAAGFPNGNSNYNWSQRTYDYHISTGKNGVQDAVFVGLITVAYSPNGGATWVDVGNTYGQAGGTINTHNDQHCFAMNPQNPAEYIIGNDGGVHKYQITNFATGAGTWTGLNAQIFDTQIYEMDVHPTSLNHVLVGTQDNASPAARGDLANWDNLYAGDGAWPAFDRVNNGVHYTQSQGMNVYRYDAFNDYTPTGLNPGISGAFIAPLIVAGNGREVFCAGNRLCYHPGPPTGTSGWIIRPTVISSGNVSELASAPTNGSVIYSGDGSGQVWRTPDKGVNFTRIDTGLPDRSIGAINVSWTDPNDILVAFSGYSGADHIYRCTNTTAGTPVWTNVTGNLPNVGVQALARDPGDANTWYAGTDVGLFMTTNGGTTWSSLHTLGLPKTQVRGLKVNDSKTHLYVATFGRGVWRVSIQNTMSDVGGRITEGGNPMADVTVYLAKLQEVSPWVRSSPNVAIPDNNPAGLTQNLYVPVNMTIKSLTCRVKVTHGATSQLTVALRHPDGTQVTLHNRVAGTNIDQQYTVTAFNGKASTGIYRLIVSDLVAGTTGTLDEFDIRPTYDGYLNVQNTLTNASGNYLFNNVEPGKYRIYPEKTGKMFGPKWRLLTTPPSNTSQSFVGGNAVTFASAVISPNVIYGLTNTFATLNLSGPAPFPMQVFITKSSALLYAPTSQTIGTGNPSAAFVLGGGNVTSDLTGTIQWQYYEHVRTASVTIKPKPIITGFSMNPSTVTGGTSSQGRLTISKPAITGATDMFANLTDDSGVATTPGSTSFANGTTLSTFNVTTMGVSTSTTVTINAYFYNSTRTVTLTVNP